MDKLDTLASKIADAIDPATQAALAAARTEAISTLVSGAYLIVIAITLAYISRLLWLRGRKLKENDKPWPYNSDEVELTFIASVVLGVIAAIITPLAVWSFVDSWVWTALLHPEVYVAKLALAR